MAKAQTVDNGAITPAKLSATGSTNRQVLTSNGSAVSFQAIPTEVVKIISANGPVQAPADGPNYKFLGPTVTVDVATGQVIYVASMAALGSAVAGGGLDMDVDLCRKGPSDANPAFEFDYMITRVPQNTRIPIHLQKTFRFLPAGSYQFGLCGHMSTNVGSGSWNYNDYSRTIATVYANPTNTLSAPDQSSPNPQRGR